MFSSKVIVSQELVATVLNSTRRDSDELNPVFFDTQIKQRATLASSAQGIQLSDLFRVFDTPNGHKATTENKQRPDGSSSDSNASVLEHSTEEFVAMLVEKNMEEYLDIEIDDVALVTNQFEKFMLRPGYYEMNQMLDKLERIDRITDQHLKVNCMKHYGTIAVGLKNLESIDDDNIVSLAKIQVARNLLKELRQQSSQTAMRVLKLHRQKANAQKVLNTLTKLSGTIGGDRFNRLKDIIPVAIAQKNMNPSNEFVAIDSAQIIQDLLEIDSASGTSPSSNLDENALNLSAFNCIRNLQQFTASKHTQLRAIVIRNWQLIHEFGESDTRIFANLRSQFALERANRIEALSEIRESQFNEISNRIISDSSIPSLSYDSFLSTFKNILASFTKLMANYHALSRWFVRFAVPSSQQQQSLTGSSQQLNQQSSSLSAQNDFPIAEFHAFVEIAKNLYLSNRTKLWQNIELKLAQIFDECDQPDRLPEADFADFLRSISEFIGTGIHYSNSEAETLRLAVQTKITSYVKSFKGSLMKSIQTSLNNERWIQVDLESLESLQCELYEITDIEYATNLRDDALKATAFIRKDIKQLVDIEAVSPLRSSASQSSLMMLSTTSSPNLDESQGITQSPSLNNSAIRQSRQRMSIKLKSMSSPGVGAGMQSPQVNQSRKYFVDSDFQAKIRLQSCSSLSFIKRIMRCLSLIISIPQSSAEICDFLIDAINSYIRQLVRLSCEKSFCEKLMKKLTLEHMNVNNESLIETHEVKMDRVMEALTFQKKYARSCAFFLSTADESDGFVVQGDAAVQPPESSATIMSSVFVYKQNEGNGGKTSTNEIVNHPISAVVVATESFLSLVSIFAKIKPFLIEFASDRAEKVNKMFRLYEEIKYEIVEICLNSVLPAFLRNASNLDALIVNGSKWDVKEVPKDLRGNGNTVAALKNFLSSTKTLVQRICSHESQKDQAVYIDSLLAEYFFKEIAEAYSKIKIITPQGKQQLNADIKQILVECSEVQGTNVKVYAGFLEKYLEILASTSVEDFMLKLEKLRDVFPLRVLKSVLFISDMGIALSKKKRSDTQIALLKNYQIFLRDSLIQDLKN